MCEPLERLEARLKTAGWRVRERQSGSEEEYVRQVTWTLESLRAPIGTFVELCLRVRELTSWEHYYWREFLLTAATVRHPADGGDEPGPEANLVGDEIQRENYRQLVRILEWFRDPTSGNFWHDPPRADEWQPPGTRSAASGGRQALGPRWADCADAQEMLRFMPGKASDRKLRLIACACARLLTLPMLHQNNVDAVEAMERYTEGLCPRREAKKLCKHSDLAWLTQLEPLPLALQAIRLVGEEQPATGPRRAADVVREIVGDPFRPVTLRHEWLRNEGAAVAHLVGSIAGEGRYDDMPILADALEDAGCRAPAILEHCRSSAEHRRGCWVMDLLLGRG